MAPRLALFLLCAAFLACQRERPSFYVDNPSAERLKEQLVEVVENPSAYVGKTVTVSGRVGEVLAEKVFTLESHGPYVERLLAVGADPFPEAPDKAAATLPGSEARFVEATGEVRLFDRAAFEQAAGTPLDAEALREWVGKPALLVKSLKVPPPQ